MAYPSDVEVWKPIQNCEGYEVSSLGNVRSVDRTILVKSKNGIEFERHLKGKPISVQPDGRGNYLMAHMSRGKQRNVHRLVAEAFIPNPLNLPEVNHKDENKENNRADNLEWCNHRYNSNYGSLRGKTRGDGNPMSKFSEDVVREIKASYIPNDKRYGVAGLAKKYGMSQTHVCAIIKGRRWGWIDSQ